MDFEKKKQHEVRLFPSSHISSVREAELRATASLLAMVRAVSEFGRAVVRMAGGPAGKLTCYTEVEFELEGEKGKGPVKRRPDGIIRVVRGKTEWKALLEVKVGNNPLDQDQFDIYHLLSIAEKFDALITISNQPAQLNGLPPLRVDGRRLRSVPVFHVSWERLFSEAQMLCRKKAIQDSDQKWMLDEWIRYVDDDGSQIIAKPNLGKHWHDVLKSARTGDLHAASSYLEDVVRHWDGFLKKAALRLRAKLGVEVQPKIPRSDRHDPDGRIKRIHSSAIKSGQLSGILKIPDAVGDVWIDVFLLAKTVRYRVVLDPPTDGRQATRVNWLLRQLRSLSNVPDDLVVTVQWDQRGMLSQGSLRDLVEDGSSLLRDTNKASIPKNAFPKKFLINWTTSLQRGRSSEKALEGISVNLERFYRKVVEGLVPYVPRAPKLPNEIEQVPENESSSIPIQSPPDPDVS